MSAYSTNKTNFKDVQTLVEALRDMGIKNVSVYDVAQPLYGYQGDFRTLDGNGHTRDESLALKADVIIRRKDVGSMSNDIGFKRNEDGTLSAIISDYDSTCYNASWLGRLKSKYAQRQLVKEGQKAGLRYAGTEKVNGKAQMLFVRV